MNTSSTLSVIFWVAVSLAIYLACHFVYLGYKKRMSEELERLRRQKQVNKEAEKAIELTQFARKCPPIQMTRVDFEALPTFASIDKLACPLGTRARRTVEGTLYNFVVEIVDGSEALDMQADGCALSLSTEPGESRFPNHYLVEFVDPPTS